MRSLVLLALILALPAALSGCVCEPLLDVRYCREGQSACDPAESEIRAWNETDAANFPAIAALLEDLVVGEHGHATYTLEMATEVWQYLGLGDPTATPDAFIAYGDGVYRLRYYSCD